MSVLPFHKLQYLGSLKCPLQLLILRRDERDLPVALNQETHVFIPVMTFVLKLLFKDAKELPDDES